MGFLDLFSKSKRAAQNSTPEPAASTNVPPAAAQAPAPLAPPAPATSAPERLVTGPEASEPAVFEPLAAQPQQLSVPAVGASGQLNRLPEAQQTVRAYDEFGRPIDVPLEHFRAEILANLQQAWDAPQRLYGMILDALQLNMPGELLPAAERLRAIDPNPERGATVLGIVRMDAGDPAGAEELYREFLAEHGASGVILTNLAKAQWAQGREDEARATLWQAIEADPNQENGVGWYGAVARNSRGQGDPGDTAAFVAAMQRAAALPGAWRPQVWLAKEALDQNDLATAKAMYAEALQRAGSPAPVVLLQSMSGDLGTAGHLDEAVTLTRPAYAAAVHGLPVGNNLIKASLDLGRLAEARTLVEELALQGRPDWSEPLHFWEQQIRRAELAREPALPQAPPQVVALAIEGPVWLPANAPSRTLYALGSEPTTGRRSKVIFLGCSVGYAEAPEALKGTLPDAQGRLSRALPLFLGESAFLHLGLETMAVIPWVQAHGFAVMGNEWADADAAGYARSAGAAAAVITHIQQTGENTAVKLRVVRADSGEPMSPEVSVPVDFNNAGDVARGLWARLAITLVQLAGDATEHVDPVRYQIPAGGALGNYLLRLEQCLAVRCAGTDLTGSGAPGGEFLSGVREIVRGQLDLALSQPGSLPLRLLLHETLLRLRELKPGIVAEFQGPVELLQQRFPLPDNPANTVLNEQLRHIFGTA